MTLRDRLSAFPPALCRLAARDGHGLMSTRKIAERAGMKKSRVHEISLLISWDTVPVGDVERFSMACGVNLMATRRKKQILKVRSWSYFVKRVKPSQRKLLEKLLTNAQAAARQAA